MASPDEILHALSLEESQSSNNIAHQVSVYKYRKKQAANDAQLLMNRIALLQKEEERARKKIEMTKDRADEIIAMRNEHGKRIESSVKSAQEEQNLQAELQKRNKEMEKQGIKNREQLRNQILTKRREDAMKVQHDKKELTKQLLKEQEKELRLKQLKKEKIRKMEEEAKAKRDAEIKAKEEEIKRYYREKALKEAEEAKKAEKLVKALEKKVLIDSTTYSLTHLLTYLLTQFIRNVNGWRSCNKPNLYKKKHLKN